MPQNRRNYYRLLQVQPDAVPEVIKAAYRALMGLHHPDAGGDHEAAALVTEAYATLCDPARRAEYDARRAERSGRRALREAIQSDAAVAARTPPSPASVTCAMCEALLPAPADANDRCTRCGAPLARVTRLPGTPKTYDRRAIPRVTKSDRALLHVDWRSKPIDAQMRDLSLDGISLGVAIPLSANQRVRIVNRAFDVVADIVTCRRTGTAFTLHAKLVTAIFTTPAGGFVSTRV